MFSLPNVFSAVGHKWAVVSDAKSKKQRRRDGF